MFQSKAPNAANLQAKVLDTKRQPTKRLKSLRDLYEFCGDTSEAKDFVSVHALAIYWAFQQAYERTKNDLLAKSTKSKPAPESARAQLFDLILPSLMILFEAIPEKFHAKWQFRSISVVLPDLLAEGNQLMKEGIRLCVQWVALLQENMMTSALEIFSSIYATPSEEHTRSELILPEQGDMKQLLVATEHMKYQLLESHEIPLAEMTDFMLGCITNLINTVASCMTSMTVSSEGSRRTLDLSKFHFVLKIWLHQYFSRFYPAAAKRCGISPLVTCHDPESNIQRQKESIVKAMQHDISLSSNKDQNFDFEIIVNDEPSGHILPEMTCDIYVHEIIVRWFIHWLTATDPRCRAIRSVFHKNVFIMQVIHELFRITLTRAISSDNQRSTTRSSTRDPRSAANSPLSKSPWSSSHRQARLGSISPSNRQSIPRPVDQSLFSSTALHDDTQLPLHVLTVYRRWLGRRPAHHGRAYASSVDGSPLRNMTDAPQPPASVFFPSSEPIPEEPEPFKGNVCSEYDKCKASQFVSNSNANPINFASANLILTDPQAHQHCHNASSINKADDSNTTATKEAVQTEGDMCNFGLSRAKQSSGKDHSDYVATYESTCAKSSSKESFDKNAFDVQPDSDSQGSKNEIGDHSLHTQLTPLVSRIQKTINTSAADVIHLNSIDDLQAVIKNVYTNVAVVFQPKKSALLASKQYVALVRTGLGVFHRIFLWHARHLSLNMRCEILKILRRLPQCLLGTTNLTSPLVHRVSSFVFQTMLLAYVAMTRDHSEWMGEQWLMLEKTLRPFVRWIELARTWAACLCGISHFLEQTIICATSVVRDEDTMSISAVSSTRSSPLSVAPYTGMDGKMISGRLWSRSFEDLHRPIPSSPTTASTEKHRTESPSPSSDFSCVSTDRIEDCHNDVIKKHRQQMYQHSSRSDLNQHTNQTHHEEKLYSKKSNSIDRDRLASHETATQPVITGGEQSERNLIYEESRHADRQYQKKIEPQRLKQSSRASIESRSALSFGTLQAWLKGSQSGKFPLPTLKGSGSFHQAQKSPSTVSRSISEKSMLIEDSEQPTETLFLAVLGTPGSIDLNVVLRLWRYIAMLFGDFNSIDIPRVHCLITQTYAHVFSKLHHAFRIADHSYLGNWSPPFLSWVLDVSNLGSRFEESKLHANKLICEIAMTTIATRPDPPQHLLDSFLAHVIKTLLELDAAMVYTILEICWPLVGMNLPGSTLLYPHLISVCHLCLSSTTLKLQQNELIAPQQSESHISQFKVKGVTNECITKELNSSTALSCDKCGTSGTKGLVSSTALTETQRFTGHEHNSSPKISSKSKNHSNNTSRSSVQPIDDNKEAKASTAFDSSASFDLTDSYPRLTAPKRSLTAPQIASAFTGYLKQTPDSEKLHYVFDKTPPGPSSIQEQPQKNLRDSDFSRFTVSRPIIEMSVLLASMVCLPAVYDDMQIPFLTIGESSDDQLKEQCTGVIPSGQERGNSFVFDQQVQQNAADADVHLKASCAKLFDRPRSGSFSLIQHNENPSSVESKEALSSSTSPIAFPGPGIFQDGACTNLTHSGTGTSFKPLPRFTSTTNPNCEMGASLSPRTACTSSHRLSSLHASTTGTLRKPLSTELSPTASLNSSHVEVGAETPHQTSYHIHQYTNSLKKCPIKTNQSLSTFELQQSVHDSLRNIVIFEGNTSAQRIALQGIYILAISTLLNNMNTGNHPHLTGINSDLYRETLLFQCTEMLMAMLQHPNDTLVGAAIELLHSLHEHIEELLKCHPGTVVEILKAFCHALRREVDCNREMDEELGTYFVSSKNSSQFPGVRIVPLVLALRDWILCIPATFMTNHRVIISNCIAALLLVRDPSCSVFGNDHADRDCTDLPTSLNATGSDCGKVHDKIAEEKYCHPSIAPMEKDIQQTNDINQQLLIDTSGNFSNLKSPTSPNSSPDSSQNAIDRVDAQASTFANTNSNRFVSVGYEETTGLRNTVGESQAENILPGIHSQTLDYGRSSQLGRSREASPLQHASYVASTSFQSHSNKSHHSTTEYTSPASLVYDDTCCLLKLKFNDIVRLIQCHGCDKRDCHEPQTQGCFTSSTKNVARESKRVFAGRRRGGSIQKDKVFSAFSQDKHLGKAATEAQQEIPAQSKFFGKDGKISGFISVDDVNDAVDVSLAHVMLHVNCYPSPSGAAALDSQVVEAGCTDALTLQCLEKPSLQFFACNNALVSLEECDDNTCRILIRTVAGKYAWRMIRLDGEQSNRRKFIPRRPTLDALHYLKGTGRYNEHNDTSISRQKPRSLSLSTAAASVRRKQLISFRKHQQSPQTVLSQTNVDESYVSEEPDIIPTEVSNEEQDEISTTTQTFTVKDSLSVKTDNSEKGKQFRMSGTEVRHPQHCISQELSGIQAEAINESTSEDESNSTQQGHFNICLHSFEDIEALGRKFPSEDKVKYLLKFLDEAQLENANVDEEADNIFGDITTPVHVADDIHAVAQSTKSARLALQSFLTKSSHGGTAVTDKDQPDKSLSKTISPAINNSVDSDDHQIASPLPSSHSDSADEHGSMQSEFSQTQSSHEQIETFAKLSEPESTYTSNEPKKETPFGSKQQKQVIHYGDQKASNRNAFKLCRSLLMELGLLSWGSSSSLFMLRKGNRLLREIRHLDTAGSVRDQHKVAVIYVAAHHRTKEEIIAAKSCSPAFDEFLSQLGWQVNLAQHRGYTGKLSDSAFPNCVLPFYATQTLEVIFHVTTRMNPVSTLGVNSKPKSKNNSSSSVSMAETSTTVHAMNSISVTLDPDSVTALEPSSFHEHEGKVTACADEVRMEGMQDLNSSHDHRTERSSSGADISEDTLNIQALLYKSRWVHVGNDSVHIVWSEQEHEYNPEMLPTRFAEVIIVIYPMTNGLFRVHVFNKSCISVGPLFHGAVVDVACLGSLVRATAVNADRELRRRATSKQFISTRLQTLRKILQNLRIEQSFEDLNASIINNST